MAVDWKARLLETKTQGPAAQGPAFQQVVQQVIAAGVPASEVKRFVAEHKDVFGEALHEQAKKAAEALLDQTSPRMTSASQTGPGVKAHNLRLDPSSPLPGTPLQGRSGPGRSGPGSALPWFQKASLPTLPPSTLKGKGDVVTVDGERFSASDVAALLQLAA